MKIAIFSDTFWPQVNGVATVARQTAINLSQAGHDVVIFTVSQEKEKALNPPGQKFKVFLIPSLPFWAYKEYRMAVPASFSLKKIKKFRPDVIHVQTPFAVGWEGVLSAKLLKIPLVGTHHTFYDYYLKHIKMDYPISKKLSWKYTASFYNRCDLVLNPSETLNDQLKKAGLVKPALVLPNPVDTDFYQPVKNADTKNDLKNKWQLKGVSIVYMGRVSYEKSIDQVIKAFSLLTKKLPVLKLMIIGDGPDKASLTGLTREMKLEDKIIFTGFLFNEGLLTALQANDIFVTASKSENQPVSVLEAMASGLPVIAVSAEGLPEIVKDYKNGFLVRPDSPEEMAEKIITLLNNQKLREQLSLASRQMALDYSKEGITSRLVDYYSSLVKNFNNQE